MKKIMLKTTVVICLLLVALPLISFAQDQGSLKGLLNQAGEGAGYNTDEELAQTGIAQVAGSVARMFISLLGVLFMAYTIYGGFLWMTAAGNEEQVSKARKIIRDGVIGLIVVLSAAGIYVLVMQAFSISGFEGI